MEPVEPKQPMRETDGGRDAAASRHRQMPPWLAAMLAVVRPARAARLSADLTLGRVWIAFAGSVCVSVVVVVYLNAAFNASSLSVAVVWMGMLDSVGYAGWAMRSDPALFTLVVAGIVLGVHAGSGLIALLVMPVGARDEPLRRSFLFSLRQVWLSMPRLVVIVFLVGSAAAVLNRADRDWRNVHPWPMWPVYPTVPNASDFTGDDAGYEQALADFNVAKEQYDVERKVYQEKYAVWSRARPWYIVDWEVVIVLASFSLGLTHLCMLVSALVVPRVVPRIERPPTCECCGYNLTMTPLDSRCPECGTPVVASLGDAVRPGPAWEHRTAQGFIPAQRRTAREALRTPTAFGRSLRVSSGAYACRRFTVLWSAAIFLTGVVAMIVAAFAIVGVDNLGPEPHVTIAIMLITGVACVAGAILVAMTVALIVGLFHSVQVKRNLLPAVNQAACYLFGFLFIWSVVGAIQILTLMELGELGTIRWLASVTPIRQQTWVMLLMFVPNIVMGLTYFVLVSRATSAARYANK